MGENTKNRINHDADEFQRFFFGDFKHAFIDLFIAELLEKELDEEFMSDKRKFKENYVEKNILDKSIPMSKFIEEREEKAKRLCNEYPNF